MIKIPEDDCLIKKDANYSKLAQNGIIPKSTKVNFGDVLIGRVTTVMEVQSIGKKKQKIYTKRDSSVVYTEHQPGSVHSIEMFENMDGNRQVIVKIRTEHYPQIGDKFSRYEKIINDEKK